MRLAGSAIAIWFLAVMWLIGASTSAVAGTETCDDLRRRGEIVDVPLPKISATVQVAMSAEERHALVIGNANYPVGGKLRKSQQDACSMERVLSHLSFEVTTLLDGTLGEMKVHIRDFLRRLRNLGRPAVVVVYYSGHGVHALDANQLLPVNFSDEKQVSEPHFSDGAVSADKFMKRLAVDNHGGTNFLVLDSCRNTIEFTVGNQEKALPKGLKSISWTSRPEGDQVTLFGTSFGGYSFEGPEEQTHSNLTEELVKTILNERGKAVHEVAALAQRAVGSNKHYGQSPNAWQDLRRPIPVILFPGSSGPGPAIVDETMYVATEENPLNVRDRPSQKNGRRITALPRGTPVTVTGPAVNSWRPVRLADGRSGFVSASLLSSTPIVGRRRGPKPPDDDEGDGLEPGKDESGPIYGNGVLYLQTKRQRTHVSIDGADWGVIEGTRRTIPGMPIGQDVQVTLSRDWYKDWTGIVPITGPENHTDPDIVELEPDFGHVTLKIKQPDAEAWLLRGRVTDPEIDPASNGGIRLEIGQEKQRVRSGDWTVLARHRLYHPEAIPLRMESGETQVKSFDLDPRHGGLRLASDPTGAELTLAGAPVGEKGVYENPTQLSGVYRVTARLACHEPWRGEVEVVDGRSTVQTIKLTRRCARVVVPDRLSPPDARLVVRNTRGKVVAEHAGAGWLDLEPGRYTLSLEAARYVTRSFNAKAFRRGSTDKIPPEYAVLERAQGTIVVVTKPERGDVEYRVGNGGWTTNPRFLVDEGDHTVRARAKGLEGEAPFTIRHKEVKSVAVKLDARHSGVAVYDSRDTTIKTSPSRARLDAYIDKKKQKEEQEKLGIVIRDNIYKEFYRECITYGHFKSRPSWINTCPPLKRLWERCTRYPSGCANDQKLTSYR